MQQNIWLGLENPNDEQIINRVINFNLEMTFLDLIWVRNIYNQNQNSDENILHIPSIAIRDNHFPDTYTLNEREVILNDFVVQLNIPEFLSRNLTIEIHNHKLKCTKNKKKKEKNWKNRLISHKFLVDHHLLLNRILILLFM